jgi:hypothetical protein
MFRATQSVLASLLSAAPLLLAPVLRAEPSGYEYFDPAPVQSSFVGIFTEDDLDLYASANLRLIEFDVIDAGAGQFVGTFIVNEGKYQRQWSFDGDIGRAVMLYNSQGPFDMYLDIERTYFHGPSNEWRYAVLSVENPENRAWTVLADVSFEAISLQSRHKRPLDLDEYFLGETVEGPGPLPGILYDAVLVENVADNFMQYAVIWAPGEQLDALGDSRWGWVPIDMEPSVAEPGKFVGVVVLVPNVDPQWWFGVEMPAATIGAWTASKGRLTNIQPNWTKPGTFNATFLLDK